MVKKNKITITKKEFEAYERVRVSGRTNMFMVSNVKVLSGLNKDTILVIMKKYTYLDKKYPGVRKKKNGKKENKNEKIV